MPSRSQGRKNEEMSQEGLVLRFLKSQGPSCCCQLNFEDAGSNPSLHLGPHAAFSMSSPHLPAWALCHVQQFVTLSKPGQIPSWECSGACGAH